MTLPSERYAAIRRTECFLRELALHGTKTPNIREVARLCLRHYPWDTDLITLAKAAPEILEAHE